jgi:hypothetical protein
VIWTIQLVHYPSFLYVDKQRFQDFSKFHADAITPIVLPLMFVELISACVLLVNSENYGSYSTNCCINVASIAAIWAWTFVVSVPCHERLSAKGWHEPTVVWLINSNWIRTVLWSMRSAVLLSS